VQQTPEIRNENVKGFSHRLEIQPYDTPVAARQTAQAILESLL
jgi:hypothetical protein